jgi:hypothetical protein
MKTSALARVGLISGVVATASLAAGFLGCGHPPPANPGNVDVIATVPVDVQVDALDFRILGPNSTLVAGHIHTPRPQEEFEQLVRQVPAGPDETIDITAKALDGQHTCMGSAHLEVRKGVTTRVHVPLECHGPGDGVVHISVGVACPQTQHLVSYMISPLSASVGGTVDVVAMEEDADAGALRYTWTATTGTFADPAAASTTYRCDSPGPVSMTLIVSAAECEETHTITEVTCSANGDGGGG